MKKGVILTILFILITTPVVGYSQYLNGNLQLGKIRNVINSIPREYYRGLDNIYMFENNCYVKGEYVTDGYIITDGYYHYEWKIHNGRVHNSRSDMYLCNLGQYKYNGDEYGILGAIWHELGHHYKFTVLKHINLSDTFADNFTDDWQVE